MTVFGNALPVSVSSRTQSRTVKGQSIDGLREKASRFWRLA